MDKRIKRKLGVTIFLVLLLAAMIIYGNNRGEKQRKLVYADSLDLVATTLNGEDLTLRELAFYVAYEENQVEQQAEVYNSEDTAKYWNTRTDHTYIRIAARNAAIQMALHDALFYQMAMDENISLSEEDKSMLSDALADFWADLTDDGKEVMLGIEYEDIADTMEKMAYAQKMQLIYSELQNASYEDYNFETDAFHTLMDKQESRIYEDVWGRVDFGNVTLKH